MNNIQNKLCLQNTLGWEHGHKHSESWRPFWRVLPMIMINEITQVNLLNNKP